MFIPGQLDQREESLLDAMVATLKDITEPEQYGMIKSTQQQLYDLYETVILTEIKGFTMSTYSYATFENEVYKLRDQLVLISSQYLSSIDQALVGLPKDFFNCDPPKHVNGETYVALRGNMIKTISLRPQIADIKNNMYQQQHLRLSFVLFDY
ncbi:Protein of unknown function [Cotesia congregata]|uniref:Uncharacterized protein n=1 Tax=Cotesia congregata TaxID=51543 RepID=A0A8J2E172_COTCN|nr:Protein of unknown function [Cotesia congregata]